MAYTVRFVNPQEHYRRLKSEIDRAVLGCLTRGDLVYRDELRGFESRLASFVGTRHAVGVKSGYHALHFALLAAGVGPGDEVITVAHTFVATVSAIVHSGATPVLVDVGPDYNIDPDRLAAAVTPRTRAIIVVHLNGRVCDMDAVSAIAERHGVVLIEDAAQAMGATFGGRRAGSFGIGCFSFYPFKVLGGFGDGGAVTTDNPAIATAISRLRFNGEDRETGEYHYHGYSAILDNVQAAVLDVKLPHLPRWIEHRRQIARLYHEGLKNIPGLRLPPFDGPRQSDVFQNYVVRTAQRDEFRAHLKEAGVETLVHWQRPMWAHPALRLSDPGLPETASLCREVLSLPMSAETSDADVAATVEATRAWFAASLACA
jgi:dTDP-4-amino-4,6-dideoxygalactose transaminase